MKKEEIIKEVASGNGALVLARLLALHITAGGWRSLPTLKHETLTLKIN